MLLLVVDHLQLPLPKALRLRRVCRRWRQILEAAFERCIPAQEDEMSWPVWWRIELFTRKLNKDQARRWLARQHMDTGQIAELTIQIQRALWPPGYKIH